MQTVEKLPSWVVRWGSIAAMVAGAAFVLKVAYLFLIDFSESSFVATLYVIGLALPLFAAAGIAARFGRTLPTKIGIYLIIAIVHLMFVMTISESIETAITSTTSLSEQHATEIPILLVGLVWLFLGYRVWASSSDTLTPATDKA